LIEQTFEVGEAPRLVIAIGAGSIEVSAGPVGVIDLSLDGGRDREFEIVHGGDSVEVRRPGDARLSRSGSTRVRAHVPPGTTAWLTGASARIEATVPLGDAVIETASGDVNLREVENAKIKSASGDLAIKSVSGAASLRTASGDVRIGEILDRLEVTTASGSVDVGVVGGDVVSSASSGDLAIRRYEGSDLELKSVSGDIRVGLPAGTKLSLDARSLSGSISLPERQTQPSPSERQSVRARIRTVSGDIQILRVQ
jgi:hypothetical protein